MRGVEHEDITKYEKYHGYQDYVIEQREKNVSELRLKLREKEQEIDRLKNEITKLSNHINYLEYHRGIPKKKTEI